MLPLATASMRSASPPSASPRISAGATTAVTAAGADARGPRFRTLEGGGQTTWTSRTRLVVRRFGFSAGGCDCRTFVVGGDAATGAGAIG
jgi:hypothetical protein